MTSVASTRAAACTPAVGGRSTGAPVAAQGGASVFRVHDVTPTRDALAVLAAVEHHEEWPP